MRSNPQLLNEFFHCLKAMTDRVSDVTGSATETSERQELVGVFALYVLYRRLTPAYVEPDAKFYKRLWAVQRRVPAVVLCGKLAWFPSDFLESYARLEVRWLNERTTE